MFILRRIRFMLKGLMVVFSILFSIIHLSAMELPNQDRLPTLSNEDMIATAGRSPQHSRWMKDHCFGLHVNGDTWEDEKLQRFFCDGLFQHYFYQFTGYDYENSYFKTLTTMRNPQIKIKKSDALEIDYDAVRKLFEIIKISNYGCFECLDYLPKIILWYRSIGDSLKSHPVFKPIGGHFQRFKIQIEKKEDDLNRGLPEQKEDNLKELIRLDRKTIDCQVLLYHWIKTVCEKANDKARLWCGNGEIATKLDDASIIEAIVNEDPWFLSLPIYKELAEVYGKKSPPVTIRTYDELRLFLIDIVDDLPDFASLVVMAVKAFNINATDEEINSYDEAFEAHRRSVLELSGVTHEGCGPESQRLETAFGDLLMEKVRAFRNCEKNISLDNP